MRAGRLSCYADSSYLFTFSYLLPFFDTDIFNVPISTRYTVGVSNYDVITKTGKFSNTRYDTVCWRIDWRT